MTPDLYWIAGPWRGRLAIATRPRGGDWLEDEVAAWRRAGVDFVVSLLEDHEAAELGLAREREIAESANLRVLSLPIPDRVPGSLPAALSLLKILVDALAAGQTVVVHCRQSIGRSGLIAAGALVTSGTPVEEALEVVSASRGQTVPETSGQLHWIRRLPSARLVTS